MSHSHVSAQGSIRGIYVDGWDLWANSFTFESMWRKLGRYGWHRMKHRWELSNEELSRVFRMTTRSKIAKWRSQEKFGKGWISSSWDSSAENVQVSYCLPWLSLAETPVLLFLDARFPGFALYPSIYSQLPMTLCSKGDTGQEGTVPFQLAADPLGFIPSACITLL